MEYVVGCGSLPAISGLAVMRTEMTVESLLELVERSGVIAADRIQPLLGEFLEHREQFDGPREVADELVAREMLTPWQAEQLLHGKHRGFFLGPYRLLDMLGSGNMGAVYLAEHEMMRRRCAIKVLPPKVSKRESSAVDRFYREAQSVAALDHPNIVRAYDVNQTYIDETKVHYLVMEYVDGQDLQRMVEKQGKLDYREAAALIRQAAEGLGHAHHRGLVHRDVKPANLILDTHGVVKVLDLGLAYCFQDEEDAGAAAERGEGVLGTADYLAPEQAVNSHTVDARADIYSLGQTFYFLLTGHPPFPTGTVPQRLFAHQTKSPEPILNTRSDAPLGLLAIIDRMTAKDPADRYAEAGEVVKALDAWLDEYADADGMRAFAARFGVGIDTPSPSSEMPASAGGNTTDEADLELAPLEDELPPRNRTAPAAGESGAKKRSDDDAKKASESHGQSTRPGGTRRKDARALDKGSLVEGLPDLAPLQNDLVTALEQGGVTSAPLGGPMPRRRARRSTWAKLLELPAFWLGVAGLVVLVLLLAIALSGPPNEELPEQPSKVTMRMQ